MISIDAEKGTIDVELSDEELVKRKSRWKQPEPKYTHGRSPNMRSWLGRRA